jgi:hypothetical protein
MADLKAQADTQLRNILESTGKTVDDFAAAIAAAGHEKHGKMVAFLKAEFSLGHGNANRIAHEVRAAAAGPVAEDDLLAAQYAGKKAPLKAIFDALAPLAAGRGSDVTIIIQKTGVSYRRKKQFALIQAPSSKRVTLGLNLDATPDDPRIKATKGMCNHQAVFTSVDDLDGAVMDWIQDAYERAG